jgi:hypothetical protein
VWKQRDVLRAQLQRLAASQVFQPCRAADGRVVRDFGRLARPLLDPPARTEEQRKSIRPRTDIISNSRLSESIATS